MTSWQVQNQETYFSLVESKKFYSPVADKQKLMGDASDQGHKSLITVDYQTR